MTEDRGEEYRANEAAYRRGWQQGLRQAIDIITALQAKGYDLDRIRKLLSTYNSHPVHEWRYSNLNEMKPFPSFKLSELEAILKEQPY